MKHAPVSKPQGKDLRILVEDFNVTTRYGPICVKAGKVWNGANIPEVADFFLGLERFSPRLDGPTLVHDDGYGAKRFTMAEYNQIFYDMMVENGIKERKARWSFKALRAFGRRAWNRAKYT